MKKMIKATGLLCAAALTAAMGFSSLAVTDTGADSLGTAGPGIGAVRRGLWFPQKRTVCDGSGDRGADRGTGGECIGGHAAFRRW